MRMSREFSVFIEQDAEGYYLASVPALRGCHTQANSFEELINSAGAKTLRDCSGNMVVHVETKRQERRSKALSFARI